MATHSMTRFLWHLFCIFAFGYYAMESTDDYLRYDTVTNAQLNFTPEPPNMAVCIHLWDVFDRSKRINYPSSLVRKYFNTQFNEFGYENIDTDEILNGLMPMESLITSITTGGRNAVYTRRDFLKRSHLCLEIRLESDNRQSLTIE